MNTRFTDDQVMTTLRNVVAENPDYVYEAPGESNSCFYVHGDRPGCVVGHVLHRMGVPLEFLAERERQTASQFISRTDLMPLRAMWALDAAQDVQDGGDPWREALDAAETAYMAA